MRLAYLYPEHLGRVQARVLQMAATLRAMAGLGARVHLLVGAFRGLDRRVADLGLGPGSGVTIEPVAMLQKGPGSSAPFSWHGVYHQAALARLRRLTKAGGLDGLMVRHLKLADFLLARRAAHGLPLLYEAHEIFAQTAAEEGLGGAKLARLAALERRVLAEADRVVAISRPLAQALEAEGLARGPLAVAPSGVDESFFAVGQDGRDGALVAYAGGLGRWKGVDLLLKAAMLTPSIRLEILGGDEGGADWRGLAALANDPALAGRVTMRPRAGQEAVRELLSRAGVAVWPGAAGQRIAAEFTSPLKLFEYLAAGCAVIAPDTPAARAVVTHGRQALLFKPDDPAALAAALERLAADQTLAGELGRAGRELARSYAWPARAAVVLAELEDIAR
ncbi:glycosyl transferase group 1 [Desulfarculus baarsii DSM 2075]|uniref:Glycosyl transferase group 1 n=1 Tax=Desulfarculus baarsii (strain ATCC 33931 / DSM 2075 / LMG 7858 / VKM B-1802 / 2st14) TaxID=644282 RepID=E1QID3_DESB2|nr:glycosyltransferase [Desulfarculus baarsii]ADK85450.1 glycosyl transferase group 1 [Desulfarculus baarsii DSM 2075]